MSILRRLLKRGLTGKWRWCEAGEVIWPNWTLQSLNTSVFGFDLLCRLLSRESEESRKKVGNLTEILSKCSLLTNTSLSPPFIHPENTRWEGKVKNELGHLGKSLVWESDRSPVWRALLVHRWQLLSRSRSRSPKSPLLQKDLLSAPTNPPHPEVSSLAGTNY